MDLEGKNATFTTPQEVARLCLEADRVLTF
jgi:hypothetical protein